MKNKILTTLTQPDSATIVPRYILQKVVSFTLVNAEI